MQPLGEVMREGKVFQAYSDESGINPGDRYTSVSVVSGEAEALNHLRDKLGEVLRDAKIREVKFSKIDRYGSPYRKAAVDFVGCAVDFAVYNRVRVDTITTDNEWINGEGYGSYSEPDLEGMYYQVLPNVGRRWGRTEWDFYPDENSGVNWSGLVSSLNTTSMLSTEWGRKRFIGGSDEDAEFQFSEVEELNSAGEPLIQLADVFAGIARFSHEDNGGCAEWVERSRDGSEGIWIPSMAGDKGNKERSNECRYELIGGLYSICHSHRLYVSLRTEKHLKTWRPENPINFWDYRRKR
jgi:hypothetical protein